MSDPSPRLMPSSPPDLVHDTDALAALSQPPATPPEAVADAKASHKTKAKEELGRKGLASKPIVSKEKKTKKQNVEQSTPHKTTRRRKTGFQEWKKGDGKSFAKIEGPEATVAAYCGFNDIGDFRRFYTSDWVLPFYTAFLSYRKHNRKQTMSLLNDAPYDTYWATQENPAKVYPPDEKFENAAKASSRMSYGAGLVAWQFLRQLRARVLSFDDSAKNQTNFTKSTTCQLPGEMSPYPKEKLPDLGPKTDFHEHELEPLNRCLSLFAHMKYATSPSQWGPRFFGKTAWDAPLMIHQDFVPQWMVPADAVTAPEAPDEFTASPKMVQSRKVTVVWSFRSKNAKGIEFVEYVKENGEYENMSKKITVTMDEDMSGDEARDKIREGLGLESLKGQLETLALCAEKEDDDCVPALVDDWDPIRKVVFKYPDQDPSLSFSCIIRLREDDEGLWESSEPPASLKNFLEQHTNDVAPKVPVTAERREETHRNIFSMTVPMLETRFEPVELFGNDKERIVRFYDGYDVLTADGRRKWQLWALSRVAGRHQPYKEDPKNAIFRKFSKEQAESINAALEDGIAKMVDLEEEKSVEDGRARYYAYQTATAGTHANVGPPIDLAIQAHGMVREDQGKEEYYALRTPKSEIKRTFRPYQANGLSWALSRLYDDYPLPGEATTVMESAAATLNYPFQVPGLMITDQTGLGKTPLALLIASHCEKALAYDAEGKPLYKPIALQVPQGLIRQWAEEIMFEWPMLTLVIAYDDPAMPAFMRDHVVSASAVREYPNSTLWPKHLHYMFDQRDQRNAKTIYLTSYETHVSRSLWSETKHHPAVSFNPPAFKKDGTEMYYKEAWEETIYHSYLKDVFGLVINDEASKLKTAGTMRHFATKLLRADRIIHITATPMINTGTCILGLLDIIWSAVVKALNAQPEDVQEWIFKRVGQLTTFNDVAKLEHSDVRRLAVLNPYTVKALVKSDNRPLIAEFFPMIEELITLRRNQASIIPRNEARSTFCNLREMIKPHWIKTRPLQRKASEEVEFQWFYRDAANRFQDAQMSIDDKGPERLSESKTTFGTAEMRELLIVSASLQAAKFNAICESLEANTLVDALKRHRTHGWTGYDVVKFMSHALKRTPPTTASGYLEFFAYGSPMLRGLAKEMHDHIHRNRPGKLLVTEDIPLLCWWWDLFMNMALMKTTTFHSALSASERDSIVKDFNKVGVKLAGLILPYEVGAFGINLQNDSSRVLVMTGAKNMGTEIQAMFRPVRMNSPREVTIIKMHVQDTVASFRESKKVDKYIVELATRAADPIIRQLAVQLLNEYREEVKAAQENEDNKELRETLLAARAREVEKMERETKEEMAGAKTVPERLDNLDPANVIKDGEKRKVKAPERFEAIEWADNGARITSDAASHRPKRVSKRVDYAEDLYSDFDSEFDGLSDSSGDVYVEDQGSEHSEGELFEEQSATPLTKRQREIAAAKQLKTAIPEHDERGRLLVNQLLDNYEKVYTLEDLDNDVVLRRGLKYIYCRKMGIPFETVPSVHIKYSRLPTALREAIEKKMELAEDSKPLLLHLFQGNREEDFAGKKAAVPATEAFGGAPSFVVKLKVKWQPGDVDDEGDDADNEGEAEEEVIKKDRNKRAASSEAKPRQKSTRGRVR
ncbi:hypothetical protein DPSP01_013126 [Paraphaeosphaeria sporulosa]